MVEKREEIIKVLSDCTEGQQMIFKRMYSPGNLQLPISDVVDLINEGSLERALDQCERTMIKNYKNKKWLREHNLNKILKNE